MQDDVRDKTTQISQEESEQTAQQFRDKQFSIKKAIIPIGLILAAIVALIAFGSYAMNQNESNLDDPTPSVTQETPTPTPDPYEGWQTYESEEFGFSFRYPEGWEVNDKFGVDPYDRIEIVDPTTTIEYYPGLTAIDIHFLNENNDFYSDNIPLVVIGSVDIGDEILIENERFSRIYKRLETDNKLNMVKYTYGPTPDKPTEDYQVEIYGLEYFGGRLYFSYSSIYVDDDIVELIIDSVKQI